MLRELYDSSTGLLQRFGVKPSVAEQFAVFEEEVGEFSAAVQIAGSGNPIEEGADVIVTVLNTLYAMGFCYEDVQYAVEAVIRKNDSKTWDSHFVNQNGKIQRKGRQ
jgi:NTP pyrophosphatase (non-canonical NTP hydrolase)